MQLLTEIDDFSEFGFVPVAPMRSDLANARIDEAVRLIDKVGGNRVGFIGLACAPCADGPQESPILEVMKRLAGSDRDVAAYDPAICEPYNPLPYGAQGLLRASAYDVIDWCETLVVTSHSRGLQTAIAARRGRCHLIDLIDLFVEQPTTLMRAKSAKRCRLRQAAH